MSKQELIEIDVDKIKANPYQPRKEFDKEKLDELASSILSNGLINPISVKKVNGNFIVVSGERRLKAYKLAKLKTIKAFVKEYASEEQLAIESLIENLQREDLTSIEREDCIHRIYKIGKFKSYSELGRKLGYKDVSFISNILKAREDRNRLGVRTHKITTNLIDTTQGVSDADRKKLFKKVINNEILPERVKEIAPILRIATEDVKKALLDDEINVEQAKRISKLKKESQRKEALKEHKSINFVKDNIEKSVVLLDNARQKRELDKKLLQVKNWICSLRNSITDSHKKLEVTFRCLQMCLQLLSVADDNQREDLKEQVDRLLELLERGVQLSEKIQDDLK